jgi:hypothetical protein
MGYPVCAVGLGLFAAYAARTPAVGKGYVELQLAKGSDDGQPGRPDGREEPSQKSHHGS